MRLIVGGHVGGNIPRFACDSSSFSARFLFLFLSCFAMDKVEELRGGNVSHSVSSNMLKRMYGYLCLICVVILCLLIFVKSCVSLLCLSLFL
mgnify:CR=1 FL=1